MNEFESLAAQLRMDLSNAQAKLSDLVAMHREVAPAHRPSRPTCPECGLSVKGPSALAEHLYLSHDGDVPEHWLTAEARAATITPLEHAVAQADFTDQPPTLGRS
jgi:hypothetical protein